MGVLTESVVEDAALAWLGSLGYTIKHGPEIAPGELFAKRQDYAQVVLHERLRRSLTQLIRTCLLKRSKTRFGKS